MPGTGDRMGLRRCVGQCTVEHLRRASAAADPAVTRYSRASWSRLRTNCTNLRATLARAT